MPEKSLSDALRGESSWLKARDLVGQVFEVVDFKAKSYTFKGKEVDAVDVQALNEDGDEVAISGTGTMLANLQSAIEAGYELPLELRIIKFESSSGTTGYGFEAPNE